MPLSPETIVFAVRALVRVGTAARDAYEQKVRDTPIRMPDLRKPVIDDDESLWAFFILDPELEKRVTGDGDLAKLWVDERPKDAASRQKLIDECTRIVAGADGKTPPDKTWAEIRFEQEEGSVLLLNQWAPGKGPPDPLTRVALAMADVALEYAGSNPSVLGIGGSGEKLIGALAANVRVLLPEVDKHADWPAEGWGRYYFVERSLTIVLHAGFKTISEHPDTLVQEKHYQDLLGNVAGPLVDLFDDDTTQLPQVLALRDTILGPVAHAALTTLTQHQRAFLGARFDPNLAVGALTGALLEEAAKGDLREIFGDEGLIRLYQAALGVAVTRPELFVDGDGARKEIARDLLSAIAQELKEAPPPFEGGVAADVAASALEVLTRHAPRFFDQDDAWELVAGRMLQEVMEGIAVGLKAEGLDGALDRLLTTEQAVELVGVVLEQAAKTPGMVVGKSARGEVKMLVAVVANAMSSKGAALLSAEAWLEVAAAAAEEAARNPARLLNLDEAKPEAQLLAKLIKALLLTAAEDFEARNGRAGAPVLFGDTLVQAISAAIRAAGGNAVKAAEFVDKLGDFTAKLNALSAERPGRVGAREWLHLFVTYVARVLDTGVLADLTESKLLGDLYKEEAPA